MSTPATPRARRPLIAIVGRPNVGKSRLFNRMTGTRFAIVEDEPGVTRDRQYGEGTWDGRAFQVVDTGGFEPESDDELLTQMKEQARIAMDAADIILFVMDGRAGLLPADREIAEMLRRADRLMVPVVNKIDGDRHEGLVGDFYALGFPELVTLSAEHGRNYDELMDRIVPYLPRLVDVERSEEEDIAVAVIGRPNAGKSTLINRLLGEERLLTSDIPGTTRDAVNTRIEVDGQSFLFIDTAGIRRKRSIHEAVEKYSVVQAFKAIDRADVVLHVLDASAQEGVSTQDKRIAGMAHEKGRAALLLLNKWDAVEKDHRTADERIRDVRDQLRFNRYAPAVTISAKTGQRVHRILPLVRQIHAEYTRRVSTAALNRVLREALNRNPPPSKGRRRLKIYYASQVASGPPTLMLVINKRELMHFSYERYLRNCLREAFAFEGAPIKIFLRERAQRRDAPALIDDD
ncbi:MAG: ribosome biogenesis GTPase Der [Deltaproteobacteria bacterium]|nr:MAG: ribosome biogenesis GTPase Der [Deltaproteobacteria bacterium]